MEYEMKIEKYKGSYLRRISLLSYYGRWLDLKNDMLILTSRFIRECDKNRKLIIKCNALQKEIDLIVKEVESDPAYFENMLDD